MDAVESLDSLATLSVRSGSYVSNYLTRSVCSLERGRRHCRAGPFWDKDVRCKEVPTMQFCSEVAVK